MAAAQVFVTKHRNSQECHLWCQATQLKFKVIFKLITSSEMMFQTVRCTWLQRCQ